MKPFTRSHSGWLVGLLVIQMAVLWEVQKHLALSVVDHKVLEIGIVILVYAFWWQVGIKEK